MTPSEALFYTMSGHWMLDSLRRWPGPGQLVARMGPEIREALSRLTSDEAQEMPIELLGGIEFMEERRARERAIQKEHDQLFAEDMRKRYASVKLRLMFDRKLKRRN